MYKKEGRMQINFHCVECIASLSKIQKLVIRERNYKSVNNKVTWLYTKSNRYIMLKHYFNVKDVLTSPSLI